MEKANPRWWESDGNYFESITGNVQTLFDTQGFRTDQNLSHLRLYGNQNILGFSGADYDKFNVVFF